MNITKEKCDEFKEYVEGLITKYHMPSQKRIDYRCLLPELFEHAAEISGKYISPRYLEGHSTGVNNTQTDYIMIMMSVISICWAIRMRKKKSEEGQCHEHTTNCSDARTFHSQRYDEWINVIEETLEALRSDKPIGVNMTKNKANRLVKEDK